MSKSMSIKRTDFSGANMVKWAPGDSAGTLRRRLLAAVFVAASVIIGPVTGFGQGFFLSNASGGFDVGGMSVGTAPSGWQFVAQPFRTSAAANGLSLSTISVEMKDFLFNQQGLFVSVFDNVMGNPGNELVKMQGNWEEGFQSFVPEVPFNLEGDKEYFLVFGSDPTKDAIFQLVTVPASGSRGDGQIPGNIAVINNTLGNWKNLNNGEAVKMELVATTVPEPGSLALIMSAIVYFAFTQRRRESQS